MNEKRHDKPGVIAPPPLLYLVALVIGLIWHVLVPVRPLPTAAARPLGGLMCIAGLAFAARARRVMRNAGTNINPYRPPTTLVCEGPFRISRNPLYVSVTALYVGVTLLVDALWPLVLLPPLLVVMRVGVIDREERYLEAKFGEAYLDYKARVRRWL
jgi:protein-S-isoprenylcysteine O-methyltransferase Ste14